MFHFGQISRRDASVAAVAFGAVIVLLVISIVKGFLAGTPFAEMGTQLVFLFMLAIIEFGMIGYIITKDREDAAAEAEQAQLPEGPAEEASEEFTEGLSEEFDGDQDGEGEGSGEGGESA